MQSVQDTPVYFFYRELLDLLPDLEVLHTVRDPFTWALRRTMISTATLPLHV